MQAYLNDEALKAKTIKAMKADIAAERLIKGSYWSKEDKNGCFVGCVIRGSNHSKFETKLGIPRLLARLADTLFERQPYEDAKKFTVDFLEAINAGSDLSGVWPKFAHYMLVDPEYGVIKFAKADKVKSAIQAVADLYQRKINGEDIDVNAWLEVRNTAASDASDAADAAYAAAAADAAADAAAADAAYAADAAADAADAYAAAYARGQHAVIMANRLVQLLRDAK